MTIIKMTSKMTSDPLHRSATETYVKICPVWWSIAYHNHRCWLWLPTKPHISSLSACSTLAATGDNRHFVTQCHRHSLCCAKVKTIAYSEHGTPHWGWRASASRYQVRLSLRQSTEVCRVSLAIFSLCS